MIVMASMKKTFFQLLFAALILFAVSGCGGQDFSPVQLDGPVLKSTASDGNLEFTGSLLNMGFEEARGVTITILLYDSEGRLIEAVSGEVSDLLPGDGDYFSVQTNISPGEVQSISYRLGYNEEENFERVLE